MKFINKLNPKYSKKIAFITITLIIVFMGISMNYGIKSFKALTVLENARSLEHPDAGDIRGWMTLEYIIHHYQVNQSDLFSELNLNQTHSLTITLSSLAEQDNQSLTSYIQKYQAAIAKFSSSTHANNEILDTNSFFDDIFNEVFSYFLLYGLPILAIILFIGTFGLPVPAGPLATIAGTLILQDQLNWATTFIVTLSACVIGDFIGYLIGRKMGPDVLTNWGSWVGLTKTKVSKINALFEKWAGITLIFTRSLASQLSIVSNILAGSSYYNIPKFIFYTIIGRSIWVLAYVGIGYIIGDHFEIASGLLGYISIFFTAGICSGLLIYFYLSLKKT